MPHFKCVACKLRLHTPSAPENLVGDPCPRCGRLFEPVRDLAEIVGFRVMEDPVGAGDGSPGTHHRTAVRVDDFFARREAVLAQARLDAGLWLDDAGDVSSEAMAQAVVLPMPTEKP